MSDQIPKIDGLPQMSVAAANIHKSIYDAINLSKKQQWVIANYVALVYAAIFGAAHSFGKATLCGRALLIIIAGCGRAVRGVSSQSEPI